MNKQCMVSGLVALALAAWLGEAVVQAQPGDEEIAKFTENIANALYLRGNGDPSLVVEGEMQADVAFDPEMLRRDYPFSSLREQANVLIFPNLSAGNIAYKLLHRIGGATAIGPILVGMRRPVHVLERGADVQDIINMAAVAVVDAQERTQSVAESAFAAASPAPTTIFSRL